MDSEYYTRFRLLIFNTISVKLNLIIKEFLKIYNFWIWIQFFFITLVLFEENNILNSQVLNV